MHSNPILFNKYVIKESFTCSKVSHLIPDLIFSKSVRPSSTTQVASPFKNLLYVCALSSSVGIHIGSDTPYTQLPSSVVASGL